MASHYLLHFDHDEGGWTCFHIFAGLCVSSFCDFLFVFFAYFSTEIFAFWLLSGRFGFGTGLCLTSDGVHSCHSSGVHQTWERLQQLPLSELKETLLTATHWKSSAWICCHPSCVVCYLCCDSAFEYFLRKLSQAVILGLVQILRPQKLACSNKIQKNETEINAVFFCFFF
jgi:hypothetical protein